MQAKNYLIKFIILASFFSYTSRAFSVDCLGCLSVTAGTCTCVSVVPQVVENCRKKSTQGLALNQTASDAMGNIALISIILASPVSAHAAIAPCISVVGDSVVLTQAWEYDRRCCWEDWTEHSKFIVDSCRSYEQIFNGAPTKEEMDRLLPDEENITEYNR